jgi:hypothetical protein
MFILGSAAVIQAAFLPGFLLLRCIRIGDGFLKSLVYSFALSLAFNHVLVFALALLRWYTPFTMYSVFGTELILVALLCWRDRSRPFLDVLRGDADRFRILLEDISHQPPALRFFLRLGLVCSFAVVSLCAFAVVYNAVTVFDKWDAVVAYNRWASVWGRNEIPHDTRGYPQVLPIAYSITYVFLGSTEVQFFARVLPALFPLMMLLGSLDLTLRQKDATYLLGTAFAVLLLLILLKDLMFSGYADAPVASLALISFCMLMEAGRYRASDVRLRHWLVAGLSMGACASTKTPGFIPVLAFPVLAVALGHATEDRSAARPSVADITAALLAMLVVVLPWQLYQHDSAQLGVNMYGPIHQGRAYVQRLLYAASLLREALGPVTLLFVAAGTVLGVIFDRRWRWIFVLLALPLVLAWALWASYDARNISVAVPFIGLVSAGGVILVVARLAPRMTYMKRVSVTSRFTVGACAISLTCLVVATGVLLPSKQIRNAQLEQQRLIGDPYLNSLLYWYQSTKGFSGVILTNYQILGHLPGLAHLYQLEFFSTPNLEDRIRTYQAKYLLHTGLEYPVDLKKGVEDGKYHEEIVETYFRLLSISQ